MPQNRLFPKSEAIDLSDEDDFSLDLFFKPLVFYVYFMEKLTNRGHRDALHTKTRVSIFFEQDFQIPRSARSGRVTYDHDFFEFRLLREFLRPFY